MPRQFIRAITLACFPLLGLVACDDPALPVAGDEIEFRTCPPDCTGGGWGNTSYAGEWSLANFNTAFGVPATNWFAGQAGNAVLTGAEVTHDNALRSATAISVSDDGELLLRYEKCPSLDCIEVVLSGAALVGARLHFEFNGKKGHGEYWVRVHDYALETLRDKPLHVYTLTTNAPNATQQVDEESRYLCYANAAGEDSPRSVFLPDLQLDPRRLSFTAAREGAVIACETGADGKAVIRYGYHQTDLETPERYTGALKMTTGDICGKGHAYTTPGRMIEIQDSLGINAWSGALAAREGDYDHTGMICRGERFRGEAGTPLVEMIEKAPCLQEIPPCGDDLTKPQSDTATFGVKVEGGVH